MFFHTNRSIQKTTSRGFTLLEVMIAIFLITVGIAGAFLLITQTIGQMAVSESQLTAAYLTQEGIEIIRNIRDTNWLEQNDPANTPVPESWNYGLTDCQTGCEADYTFTTQRDPTLPPYGTGRPLCLDATGFYKYIDATCTGATQTKFKRKITIVPDGTDILKVKVEVTWQEKGQSYQYSAQENLYNWR